MKIRETLVYGKTGRAKTKKSKRDVDMLTPVYEAPRSIAPEDEYVFRDREGGLDDDGSLSGSNLETGS